MSNIHNPSRYPQLAQQRRCSSGFTVLAPPPPPKPVEVVRSNLPLFDGVSRTEVAVLRELIKLIETNDPLPSVIVLAARSDLSEPTTTSALQTLHARGKITIMRDEKNPRSPIRSIEVSEVGTLHRSRTSVGA